MLFQCKPAISFSGVHGNLIDNFIMMVKLIDIRPSVKVKKENHLGIIDSKSNSRRSSKDDENERKIK